MPEKQSRKTRLNPMKLLCLLLYGSYSFVEYSGNGQVAFPVGPMARLIRVKNSHLLEYLRWLEERCLITSLKITSTSVAQVSFEIKRPPLFITPEEEINE